MRRRVLRPKEVPWDNQVGRHKHLFHLSPLAFKQSQIVFEKFLGY